MTPAFYHILHLLSLVVLTGGTFYGFAGSAGTKKNVMIATGIASVLMLVSGIGLLHKLAYGFPGWAIVKIVCWLGLSALAGIGYRKRDKTALFLSIILALVFVSLVMVYNRPF